jgi:hypothetical protein
MPTSKVKVTLEGQSFTLSFIQYILCLVHNFIILVDDEILKLLDKNVHNNKMMFYEQSQTPIYKVKVTLGGQSLTWSVTGYDTKTDPSK